jgi:S-adenosylmethionine synthetase
MKRKLIRAADELNGVIHSRNLYRNGRRYYDCRVVDGKLTVRDLYTEQDVPFVNDGSFVDGYGRVVILESID